MVLAPPSSGSPDRPPADFTPFDDSRWPLLVLRLPFILTALQHQECLEDFSGYLRRGKRFALLVDLTGAGVVPLDQRWRQVEWFEQEERALLSCVVGSSVVITSPLMRLSLSAILHFKRVDLPLAIFPDRAGAEAWAAQSLCDAGLARASRPP